jgi:hypothetical protein
VNVACGDEDSPGAAQAQTPDCGVCRNRRANVLVENWDLELAAKLK